LRTELQVSHQTALISSRNISMSATKVHGDQPPDKLAELPLPLPPPPTSPPLAAASASASGADVMHAVAYRSQSGTPTKAAGVTDASVKVVMSGGRGREDGGDAGAGTGAEAAAALLEADQKALDRASAVHAARILGSIVLQQQQHEQEDGGGSSSLQHSHGQREKQAPKSPSTREIHVTIERYMRERHLDPYQHYSGIIRAIKVQVLSRLLSRDMSAQEVQDTAALLLASPVPATSALLSPSGRKQQQRHIQRFFDAEAGGSDASHAAFLSPIVPRKGDARYPSEDECDERKFGGLNGTLNLSQEHVKYSSQRQKEKDTAEMMKTGTLRSTVLLSKGQRHQWVPSYQNPSSPHQSSVFSPASPKVPAPLAGTSAATAKALHRAVSALSETYSAVDIGDTVPEPASAPGSGRGGGEGKGTGDAMLGEIYKRTARECLNQKEEHQHRQARSARKQQQRQWQASPGDYCQEASKRDPAEAAAALEEAKHRRLARGSVRRHCSCDNCQAAPAYGESSDEYDYQTQYNRHGHKVGAPGSSSSMPSSRRKGRTDEPALRLSTGDDACDSPISCSTFGARAVAGNESSVDGNKNAQSTSFGRNCFQDISPTSTLQSSFDADIRNAAASANKVSSRGKDAAISGSRTRAGNSSGTRSRSPPLRPRFSTSTKPPAPTPTPVPGAAAKVTASGGTSKQGERRSATRTRITGRLGIDVVHAEPSLSPSLAPGTKERAEPEAPRSRSNSRSPLPVSPSTHTVTNTLGRSSSGQGGSASPLRYRFCTICSMLVSPDGTSSTAFLRSSGSCSNGAGALAGGGTCTGTDTETDREVTRCTHLPPLPMTTAVADAGASAATDTYAGAGAGALKRSVGSELPPPVQPPLDPVTSEAETEAATLFPNLLPATLSPAAAPGVVSGFHVEQQNDIRARPEVPDSPLTNASESQPLRAHPSFHCAPDSVSALTSAPVPAPAPASPKNYSDPPPPGHATSDPTDLRSPASGPPCALPAFSPEAPASFFGPLQPTEDAASAISGPSSPSEHEVHYQQLLQMLQSQQVEIDNLRVSKESIDELRLRLQQQQQHQYNAGVSSVPTPSQSTSHPLKGGHDHGYDFGYGHSYGAPQVSTSKPRLRGQLFGGGGSTSSSMGGGGADGAARYSPQRSSRLLRSDPKELILGAGLPRTSASIDSSKPTVETKPSSAPAPAPAPLPMLPTAELQSGRGGIPGDDKGGPASGGGDGRADAPPSTPLTAAEEPAAAPQTTIGAPSPSVRTGAVTTAEIGVGVTLLDLAQPPLSITVPDGATGGPLSLESATKLAEDPPPVTPLISAYPYHLQPQRISPPNAAATAVSIAPPVAPLLRLPDPPLAPASVRVVACIGDRIGKLERKLSQAQASELLHPDTLVAVNNIGASLAYVEVGNTATSAFLVAVDCSFIYK
jgi:hypothetical protein